MSANAAAFTCTWPVGRYRATLSCPLPKPGMVLSAVCEWDPEIPQRLTEAEIQQYRIGRDAALKEMSATLGVTVGVVDL